MLVVAGIDTATQLRVRERFAALRAAALWRAAGLPVAEGVAGVKG